jgi:hypothetical protein
MASRKRDGHQAGGSGVYGDVLTALHGETEVCRANGASAPPIVAETVSAMKAGEAVVVPQSLLPKRARPPLVAGRTPSMARLSADGEVRLLGQPCGRAILLWLGIWDDGDELLIAKHGPDALSRLHGECCGL